MQFRGKWSDLKAFATARGLSIQYLTIGNMYCLCAIDGAVEVLTQIPIVTPTPSGSDQADFETNFLSSTNKSPRGNVVQVLGSDTLTLCPFGAFSDTTLLANQTTNWDIELPQTMSLRGAKLFSPNATLGDWISVTVIDKTNVIGAGGTPDAPTVLGQYVISWYVVPGVWDEIEDVSISQQLPAGVFLRVAYTSVGSTAPQAVLNFISYLGTP